MVDSALCIDSIDHWIRFGRVSIYVNLRDYFLARLTVNFKMMGDVVISLPIPTKRVYVDSGNFLLSCLEKPRIF